MTYILGNEKRSIGTQRRRCSAGEYACKSGECITSEKVCDHRYNCKDGSDESRCDYFLNAQHDYQRRKQPNSALLEGRPCAEEEFRCPNLPYNLCLHYDALCNARNDCGDWSDEKNCESKEQEDDEDDRRRPEGVPIGACAAGEFQCIGGSRRCIPGVKKCNREYDCQDGSDELDCNYFVAAHRHNPNYNELAAKLAEDTRRRLHHERYIKLQQEHRQRLRQQEGW
ncbi:low-density lipoprotein receptor domain class A domain-containing protein [Ditylenchus destructor]|nr:low-density lipoprotein receptor domain class A domain-containing protein [Ditylenchus destructor]